MKELNEEQKSKIRDAYNKLKLEEQENLKHTLYELSDRELNKVNGGNQAEADKYLEPLMKYYNVSTKEEAFQKMTDVQKYFYQLILNTEEFEKVYDVLDKN